MQKTQLASSVLIYDVISPYQGKHLPSSPQFVTPPSPSLLFISGPYCLVGLMVKASASRVEGLGFQSHLRWDFSGSSHTNDLKIDNPVATLPGAWYCRVSTGTGWPGVSILWLGEVDSLICSLYVIVTACKIVSADPSGRYTSMLLGL